jgi:hypothetical protein
MSNVFTIESFLLTSSQPPGQLAIDIGLADPGFYLDAYSPNRQTNQLWEAVEDQEHPGYFFIQSIFTDSAKQHLVIDIKGVTKTNRSTMKADTSLIAHHRDMGWHENQLWTIGLNPGTVPNTNITPDPQVDFIFIQSYLKNEYGKPYVIDMRGWSAGGPLIGDGSTKLDAHPQKATDTGNQLWRLVPQSLTNWPYWGKITSIVPSIGSVNMATVNGTGFSPGATLYFFSQLYLGDGTTNYYGPLLGVADFAGNVSMLASLEDWGLGYMQGGTLVTQAGLFAVGIGYNSGPGPEPKIATASAQWSGSQFTNFSTSP